MRSLDQVRAGRAFAAVAALDPAEDFDKARALPMMLLQNGLLATWAFLLAKDKGRGQGEGRLLAVFLDHFRASFDDLVGDGPPAQVFRSWVGQAGGEGLDARQLQRLSAEAVELAGWIKRAVEARSEECRDAGDPGGG